MRSLLIYVLIMAVTTYLIRMLPLVIFRKEIKSRFIKSFLHYVPYSCLAAMTFPAVLYATQLSGMPSYVGLITAGLGFISAVIIAWRGKGLPVVASVACLVTLTAELAAMLILKIM